MVAKNSINIMLPDVGAARLSSPSSCSYFDANASLGNFTLPNYKVNQILNIVIQKLVFLWPPLAVTMWCCTRELFFVP